MENKKVESFQDLIVWQKGIQLVSDIYDLTENFPKDEMFGLSGQLKRAAVSVPANIAEGWGNGATKNYGRFLRIARGSLFEVDTLMIIATRLKFVNQERSNEIRNKITETGRMLNALITKLKNKKTSGNKVAGNGNYQPLSPKPKP